MMELAAPLTVGSGAGFVVGVLTYALTHFACWCRRGKNEPVTWDVGFNENAGSPVAPGALATAP